MSTSNEYSDQISISLDLYGSECSAQLENSLHNELNESFKSRVRSWHGPAAGAPIMVQAVMDIYNNLPDEIQQVLISLVLTTIRNAIKKLTEYEPAVTRFEIRRVGYDIVFYGHEGEEIPISISEMNELVRDIGCFVENEHDRGNIVGGIELPCDLSRNENRNVCHLGDGSMNLWYVKYKDSVDGVLFACYDNENDFLINEVEPIFY